MDAAASGSALDPCTMCSANAANSARRLAPRSTKLHQRSQRRRERCRSARAARLASCVSFHRTSLGARSSRSARSRRMAATCAANPPTRRERTTSVETSGWTLVPARCDGRRDRTTIGRANEAVPSHDVVVEEPEGRSAASVVSHNDSRASWTAAGFASTPCRSSVGRRGA